MSTLTDWITAVCAELGLDRATVEERAILDLARDAAHHVDRPAAPITAFLLGVAVGQGAPFAATAARLAELATTWESPAPPAS